MNTSVIASSDRPRATRAAQLSRLDEPFDLLVVGGGINGAGIARDAAMRGLRTVVVEMHDLAYGTSSRSSKLVHGGLRYLEMYEFGLVFEAVNERRVLLRIAPHLVQPLGFMFPVYKSSRHGMFMMTAAMWLYDALSLFSSPHLHRRHGRKSVISEEPLLNREGLRGAPQYWDCATDDARLTLESALDGVERGAVVATHTRVERFVHDEAGRVCGAEVVDMLDGTRRHIRATAVINASGPWTDRVLARSEHTRGRLLRTTKGIHVVVPRTRLPVNNAIVLFHPKDGRVMFALPWGDSSYIGTTDTDFEGDPDACQCDENDVRYVLEAAAAYFPDAHLDEADVIATWAGLRPLVKPDNDSGVSASAVSREHSIIENVDGIISIAGGKLTTYRRMSAEVVSAAIAQLKKRGVNGQFARRAHSNTVPLPGARDWPAAGIPSVAAEAARAAQGLLTPEVCTYLATVYGTRAKDVAALVVADPRLAERLEPGRPEILAQVDYAVLFELAATVTDVLRQRTQLHFRDPRQGLDAAPKVAGRMGDLLGWDESRRAAEIAEYRVEVERTRAWRKTAVEA
jgi:glycerol-3-phosphate dehydrogenase